MNRHLFFIAAALVAGCVSDSPLYVTGFSSLDPKNTGECDLDGDDKVTLAAGTLDLSGTSTYELVVKLKSDFEAVNTPADDRILIKGEQRNTVVLDQILFSYIAAATATIPVFTLEAETVPISIVIKPGEVVNVRMNLLGPKALETLGKTVVNAGENTDIRVTFEFSGQINSGGKIKSNLITFPIKVFRSGRTCAPGTFLCATGPCKSVGGQDGSPIVCSSPSSDGGTSTCPEVVK